MSSSLKSMNATQKHWVADDEFELSDGDEDLLAAYNRERKNMSKHELSIEQEEYKLDLSFLIDMKSGEVDTAAPRNSAHSEKTRARQEDKWTEDTIATDLWEQIERQDVDVQVHPPTMEMKFDCQFQPSGSSHSSSSPSVDLPSCSRTCNRKCSLTGGPYCRGHCIRLRQLEGGTCRVHRSAQDQVSLTDYSITQEAPTYPRDRNTFWRMVRSRVHFVESKHAHPCEVCDLFGVLCENLRRLEMNIAELRAKSVGQEDKTLKRYVYSRHKMRKKICASLLHFIKNRRARQYANMRAERLTQHQTQVIQDYGSRFNLNGQKANALIMCSTHVRNGRLAKHFLINICCAPGERSENWAFFRTVWNFHLMKRKLQGSGWFSNFTKVELCGDNAAHFKNDRVMYYQSQWFEHYGVDVEGYFFCDRHGYGPADGIWGVLSMLFKKGENKGVTLRTAEDYTRYFFKVKKEKPGILENVEMWPFVRVDSNPLHFQSMRTSLQYGI